LVNSIYAIDIKILSLVYAKKSKIHGFKFVVDFSIPPNPNAIK